jgi:serine/threonine-protein kinase
VVAASGQGAPAAAAVPSSASVTAGSVTPGKTEPAEPVAHPAPTTTAKAPGKKKPATPSTPVAAPAPTVKYVTPAKVLQVVDDNGKAYVMRVGVKGFVPDVEVDVVGPPLKNNKREVLGKARVVSPPARARKLYPLRAFLELDDKAQVASGDLFLDVSGFVAAAPDNDKAEAATDTEEPATAEAPTKPEKKSIYGSVREQTWTENLVEPGIKIRNTGTTPWTDCTVVKDRRKSAWLGSVAPHEEKSVSNKRFTLNTAYDVGSGKVGIYCDEGETILDLK